MKEYIESQLNEIDNVLYMIDNEERTDANINDYFYFTGKKDALIALLTHFSKEQ